MNTFASTHGAPLSTRRETGWSIFMGIILILAGFAAIWVPFAAGLVGTIFFGCVVLVSGIAHLAYAWFGRKDGGVLWQILIGLIYLIAGVTMLLLPVNVFALTLVLACYIAVEGVLELVFFLWLRLLPGSAWFLVDGIISLLLSILILVGWPSSGRWARSLESVCCSAALRGSRSRWCAPVRRSQLEVEGIDPACRGSSNKIGSTALPFMDTRPWLPQKSDSFCV